MNIIIPVGGKGERFKNAGYIKSKPLIEIFEKPMIFYILDNLVAKDIDNPQDFKFCEHIYKNQKKN